MTDGDVNTPATGTGSLTDEEHGWLAAVRAAGTLARLQEIVGADSDHAAYLEAKPRWRALRSKELASEGGIDDRGIPGTSVAVDGRTVHVHGITHADTEEEREFLREHVRAYLEDGTVYCEQGIRPMYFGDFDAVCEVDDYRWAMYHCREQDIDSHIPGQIERAFDEDESIRADIHSVAARFRDVTFSVIESGSGVYGDRFSDALGDVASDFLMTHEEYATGEDFTSFRKSREAARDPARLVDLQRYYLTVFLPQPLEREWLRRHDPELELFTHARNERIAAYVLSHAPGEGPVHVVTGAAHQPGIVYYLEAYRDGEWSFEPFEVVP